MKPRDLYFANPAISRGDLLNYKRSTLSAATNLKKTYDSPAMVFGRAYHSYMEDQEGAAFYDDFFVFDETDILESIDAKSKRATSIYKTWKKEQIEIAGEKEIISQEDFLQIVEMANNVYVSNFYINTIGKSENVKTEQAFYATINGRNYKALADVVIESEDSILIIDHKTTRETIDENPFTYIRAIKKYDLHLQDVHYRKIIEAATGKKCIFIFLFAENHGAHECMAFTIKEDNPLILDGEVMWEKCNDNLIKYKNGEREGVEALVENGMLII
jgi:hypothetical protein